MQIAVVVGQVVATVKEPGLASHRLLVLRRTDPTSPTGEHTSPQNPADHLVAVDLVGVGRGEVVLVATGSAARAGTATGQCPTDAAVVAVLDEVVHEGAVTFTKS